MLSLIQEVDMSSVLSGPLRSRLLKLLKATLISLLLVKSTTFGWNMFPSAPSQLSVDQEIPQRLSHTVRILSQDIGARNYAFYGNLRRAAQYIKESFSNLGYAVEEWSYAMEGKGFSNIFVSITKKPFNEYLLIGAHYDSCFNPGADDNASGVAGLLELARQLKDVPINTNVMLVAFVNEEPPFFATENMGSRVFVRQLKEKGIKVRAAIVLEMIGFYTDQPFSQKYLPPLGLFYPNRGNFIALVGNFHSKGIVDFIRKDFQNHRYFPIEALAAPGFIPGINFSDHASFWEAGIPAVMVTDTAYLRNPNYHQPTDTMEKLDFEKMARVIAGLKETILRLANK